MKRDKYIGIDPGKRTGIAVYNRGSHKLEELYTSDFAGAWKMLGRDDIRKVFIDRSDTGKVWHGEGATAGAIARIGRNVGSVLREADLLIDRARSLGLECAAIPPKGKTGNDYFRKLTGWKGRTNPHMRDAGMLVWGF